MSGVSYGIDIASYQAGLNLAEIKSEGFSFAYVKATQGVNYIDPDYSGWAANPGGLHFVPYHYCSLDNAAAQAAYFRSVVGGSVKECMLDEEIGGANGIVDLQSHVNAFKGQGFVVDLYLPHWRWLAIGSPDLSGLGIRYLIASDYPSNMPGYASALYPGDSFGGWNEYGNKKPDILQFTDNATVDKQAVDADAADSSVVWDATPTPVSTPSVPAGWSATVQQVQQQLNRWPFSTTLATDNILGPLTIAAIHAFQEAAEIAVDGIVGPITWSKLNTIYDTTRPQVQQGSTGSAVVWVQQRLNALHNYGLTVDGVFGPKTFAAVKDFQSKCGLSPDGIVGKETNAALQL